MPTDATQRSFHALPVDAALAAQGVDRARGLSSDEAQVRRARVGLNALPEGRGYNVWLVLLSQLKSPLIYMLLAAAAIALWLGEVSDAIVIVLVVLINALIGAFQEGRAERSLAALRKLSAHKAHALRDGQETILEASELVPGDLLLLTAGDAVSADARLVQCAALQVAEAALTGESVPVSKSVESLAEDTTLAERNNMVYSGTHVTSGRALGVVVGTGLQTEIGKIAQLTEAAEQPPTPLEQRVTQFGRRLIWVALGLFALILGIGALRGLAMSQIAMIGISQVVGMIPEGLPVAMTIALAVGVQRMARRGAVVRRLSAVETLGSTTIICTDKTGTLTRNEMTVTRLQLASGREVEVTGVGYAPVGEFRVEGKVCDAAQDGELRTLLEAGLLCNDASLTEPSGEESRFTVIGDPTEAALVTLAAKAGLDAKSVRDAAPRLAELPFDADTKLMATEHTGSHGSRVIVKGAPEMLLPLCGKLQHAGEELTLDASARAQLSHTAERMAAQALRVLAVAAVDGAHVEPTSGFAAFSGKLTFLGLLGQLDPARDEVAEAVRLCRLAGVRPVMVTGDHKVTGVAIARTLGISSAEDLALDGQELDRMSDGELTECIERVTVFARVQPAQKLRIVEAYQKRGEVVAMTGDGVNDAPALVRANVGVAMGITGTDVAKEAAKIVITDDNFASIVAAVEEGRVVYRNIKKVILFLFATSMAEVSVLLFVMLLGYPPPFNAVQILWNNLVTEGLITVNLIMEPAEGEEMRQKPSPSAEPLLTRALVTRLLWMTPVILLCTLGWFAYRLSVGAPLPLAQTEAFTLLVVCEWFNVLNCRSEHKSALSFGLFRNPWLLGGLVLGNLLHAAVIFVPALNRIFHTVPIGGMEVLAIGAIGSLVLWVEELRKWLSRRALSNVAVS